MEHIAKSPAPSAGDKITENHSDRLVLRHPTLGEVTRRLERR